MTIELTFQRNVCKEILEICKPIFDTFKISFFSHSRAYRNGQFTALMTNTDLSEYYINQKYPLFGGKGAVIDSGYYILSYLKDELRNIQYEFRERFNVDNLLLVVENQKEYDDIYAFATTPQNGNIVKHYLNERQIFKHFILYYKDKSASLLKKADRVKYSIEHYDLSKPCFSLTSAFSDPQQRKECLDKMALKKIHIENNAIEAQLSNREFECLKYVVKNYTLKEIGKHLNLSPRTIETYLNNLKYKLKCDGRSQLIDIASKLNLFES